MTTLPFSSDVYLCDKDRFIQTTGTKGTLNITQQGMTFSPADNTSPLSISLAQIVLVDLSNIQSKWQFIIKTSEDSHVFILYKPRSIVRALLRGLINPSAGFTGASQEITKTLEAKRWKDVFNAVLPTDHIKQRTEVRLLRTIFIGLGIGVFMFLAFMIVLKIVLK